MREHHTFPSSKYRDFLALRLFIKNSIDQEYERNRERYALLRWAQQSFDNFTLVPPGMGICHQINLEYLSRCVQVQQNEGRALAIPDTLIGTYSHTTMINGLGVLGWGVGGIEAEACMLGQPLYDGDLVIADDDGVVIWPKEQIDVLLGKAEVKLQQDNERLARLQQRTG